MKDINSKQNKIEALTKKQIQAIITRVNKEYQPAIDELDAVLSIFKNNK